jgi:hypothetical protein
MRSREFGWCFPGEIAGGTAGALVGDELLQPADFALAGVQSVAL